MNNYSSIIDSTVNDMRDEIILFIQNLVQSPSLANDENDVQKIILNKLESLQLKAEIIPINFDSIKDHHAIS